MKDNLNNVCVCKKNVVYYIIMVTTVIVSFWRATLGLHGDEAYLVSLGNMIASGNLMFKECWSSLQLSAIFNAPIIGFYKFIMGDLEGVVLFIRIITIFIQFIIALLFYKTFKSDFNEIYVMIASWIFMIYTADFSSLMYKQEIIFFTTLLIIFLYRYYKNGKRNNLIIIGGIISASVLVFPTSILYLVGVFYLLWNIFRVHNSKYSFEKNYLSIIGIVVLTCFVCFLIFMVYIGCTTGIRDFVKYFPIIFQDDNLNTNFLIKLIHPIIKLFLITMLAIIPIVSIVLINKYTNIRFKLYIPIVSLLLITSFFLQVFIERSCVTWHIINYPYEVSFGIILLLYFISKKSMKGEMKIISQIIIVITFASVVVFSLASNQGNITSMYGMIFSAMLLLLFAGEFPYMDIPKFLKKEGKMIGVTFLLMGFATYFFLVYETETTIGEDRGQRNIFTERNKIEEGPAKGIYLGEDMYTDYIKIYPVIQENVKAHDKLLILDNYLGITSLGYMMTDVTYSTYSPQGGWGTGFNGKLAQFYECNPNLEPTVVIMSKKYIGDIDQWTYTIDGEYLKALGFGIKYDKNDYLVLRKTFQ